MESTDSKTKNPYSYELAAVLLSMVLIITVLYVLQSVLVPLMFAILISISLYPVSRFFERLRFHRALASILSVIIAILVISGLFWFIVKQVITIGKNGTDLQSKFITIFNAIQLWVTQRFGVEPGEITARVRDFSDEVLSHAGTYLSAAFGSIGGVLAGAVLVPLFAFFFLYYRDFFREFFFRAFERTPKQKVHDTLNKIYGVVQGYLVGLITVMAIVAILNTIGLMVLGIQYAWFFGTLASLLMLLPYIGIAIGSILPALFALATKDSAWYALGVVGWFQVVQFLEGNLITPNIVGGKVSINPIMAIISILLGGMLFGLAGLILALPLTAVLKVLFDAIPTMNAFGFLIGEPEGYHTGRSSTAELIRRYALREKRPSPRKEKKSEPDTNENSEKSPGNLPD